MNRALMLLGVLAWLVSSPLDALAQEEGAAKKIEDLIARFKAATENEEKKAIVADLYKLGEPAMQRVEALAQAEKGKAAKLRDRMYMQILVSDFEGMDEKHRALVYAGQFAHLKKYGKRAVAGALLLLKDYSVHEPPHRGRAWQVLADLGDRSVLPELKKISEDFLAEDEQQLNAVYAMAALGDTSAIEKKVEEYRDRMKDEQNPDRKFGYLEQIASIYYHGRQYPKSIAIYKDLIARFDRLLAEHGEQLSDEQTKGVKGTLANWTYNCACVMSLAGKIPAAYAMLARALKLNPGQYLPSVTIDGDLINLRGDPGFKGWYANARKGVFPAARPPGPGEKKPVQHPAAPERPAPANPPAAAPRSGENEPPPTPEALAAAARLVEEYLNATGKARAQAFEKLRRAGAAAFVKLEAQLADDAGNKRVRNLYEKLCAELVLDTLRAVEKAGGETLTFAGQFDMLKKHGPRASTGALAIFKDYNRKMQYRTWAADALGDIGDRGVIPELKKVAGDFLYDDAIQEHAAYAMAALGDTSALLRKIEAFKEDLERGSVPALHKVAHMWYRGRQYRKAIEVNRQLLEFYEKVLAERQEEMDTKQRRELRDQLCNLYYSDACYRCLTGDLAGTYEALEKCAGYGAKFVASIARDGDLRRLRADQKFKAWYAALKTKAAAAKVKDKAGSR